MQASSSSSLETKQAITSSLSLRNKQTLSLKIPSSPLLGGLVQTHLLKTN